MRSAQSFWTEANGWSGDADGSANLALVFGGVGAITNAENWNTIRGRFPHAILMGCSTGGEIHGADVFDESLSVTALTFENTPLRATEAEVESADGSFGGVARSARLFPGPICARSSCCRTVRG